MATDMKRTTTIKLGHDGDEIRVNPSVEVDGSVAIHLTDSQEIRPCVGVASPPECDAIIAAIGRALGRPTPTSTPLADALRDAIWRATQEAATWDKVSLRGQRAMGIVDGLEQAAAMVREQGATVPRAGVEALRARLDAHPLLRLNIHSSTYARDASLELDSIRSQVDALLGVTEAEAREAKERTQRATLAAAGLWPVAAPSPGTAALRGELLMSGQTEAIDALDRLAKGGER